MNRDSIIAHSLTLSPTLTSTLSLEGVESSLSEIAAKAKTSVSRLTQLVKRNGEIQAQIKLTLERQVLHDIVSTVVNTDRNQDFALNDAELGMLVMRLKAQKGVQFDETNFRKLVETPCTLASILKVVRNLMDDDVPEEENVFHLQPRELILDLD